MTSRIHVSHPFRIPSSPSCMSRDTTNPTKWACAQRKLRSAWASAKSDQSLRCPMKKAWVLSYPLSTQRSLIRLGGCPGGSESSPGAHSFCWFCHVVAHITKEQQNWIIMKLLNVYLFPVCGGAGWLGSPQSPAPPHLGSGYIRCNNFFDCWCK